MSDYTKTTDFLAKDALAAGDPDKLVLGAELDVEFNAIAAALATKTDGNGAVTTGDKGDITVSAAGLTWTIDAGVVTLAKLADLTYGTYGSFIGRYTASTGVPQESYFGNSLRFSGDTLVSYNHLMTYDDYLQTTVVSTVTATALTTHDFAGGTAEGMTTSGDVLKFSAKVRAICATGSPETMTLTVGTGASGTTVVATAAVPVATGTTVEIAVEVEIVRTGATTGEMVATMTVSDYHATVPQAVTRTVHHGTVSITWASAHKIILKAQPSTSSASLSAVHRFSESNTFSGVY